MDEQSLQINDKIRPFITYPVNVPKYVRGEMDTLGRILKRQLANTTLAQAIDILVSHQFSACLDCTPNSVIYYKRVNDTYKITITLYKAK